MKSIKYIILFTVIIFSIVYGITSIGDNKNLSDSKGESNNENIASTGESTTIKSQTQTDKNTETNAISVGGEPEDEITTTTTTTEDAMENIDNEWALFLVNQDNALPANFKVETAIAIEKYTMDARMVKYVQEMFADAKKDGIKLIMSSAYRSISYQQQNFDRDVKKYEDKGMTHEEAVLETAKNIAYPGESEHNAGLATDIVSDEFWQLEEEFENTKAFSWLSENAHKYGFILRYPKDKVDITKITYEPWHYRFVGLYHAERISNSGKCLEEYMKE